MAGKHTNFLFGAALGVVIVMLAITLWKVNSVPYADVTKKLAAIDAKIEAANATLAMPPMASTAVVTNDRLDGLDAKITKVNAALAELQEGALLKSIGEKLDALNTGLNKTDTALANIQKATAETGVAGKLEAINVALADLKEAVPAATFSGKIDQLGASIKSTDDKLAEIKRAIPSEGLDGRFETIASQIERINAKLADIQQTSARMGDADAGKAGTLHGAVGDLKKSIDEAASLRDKLANEVGKLQDAVKAAAKPKPSEVVVVYLDMPDDAPMPQTTATVSPLRIQFKNVGSADDDGQAAIIAAKLSDIVKNREGCTISVAGYADTLGGDKINLTLSRKRARVIAEKLKTAFAGKPVQINESAWGERRLADWTPDETAQEANRRVDVAVSCKG